MNITYLEVIRLIEMVGIPILISSLVIYFVTRYVNEQFRVQSQFRVGATLATHFFFEKVRFLLVFKINRLKLGDEGRTLLFRDMLRIKLTFLERQMTEVVNDKSIYRNEETFARMVMESVLENIEGYEAEWRKDGIPELAIEKFAGWHSSKVDFMRDNIKAIIDSGYYDTLTEKMASILHIYSIMVDLIVLDAEKTLKSLNGQLKGVQYKDKVLE